VTDRIRVIDVDDPAAVDTLETVLAEDPEPAIVRVPSSKLAERILAVLRPHDELASRDETPAMLAMRIRRLAERRDEAAELAQRRQHIDPLTGLPDRLRCMQWLEVDENAWPVNVQRGLLFMDLDELARFNETHGRGAGDHLLRGIADELRLRAQPGDRIYRFELEEFVVILERESREAIVRDAEALRRAVAGVGWPHAGGTARVTASAGLSFLRSSGFRYVALQQADTAMYMAKILGRDNLVQHEDVRRLAHEAGATLELADLSEQAEVAKTRLAGMAGELNRRLLEQARLEANLDALTQIYNRRYFDDRIARQMAMARRDGAPLAVAMFDIDDFRDFNKVHGHPTGDAVLRGFAQVAMRNVRGADWLARYGGEEFCLVMAAPLPAAQRVAERIREAVAGERMTSLDGVPIGITVSVGVVAYDAARDPDPDHLVQRASRANRDAKDAGKNRVVVA